MKPPSPPTKCVKRLSVWKKLALKAVQCQIEEPAVSLTATARPHCVVDPLYMLPPCHIQVGVMVDPG